MTIYPPDPLSCFPHISYMSEPTKIDETAENTENTETMVPPQDIVFPLVQPGKRYSKCKKATDFVPKMPPK